jgi:hypothetical protein
VARLSQGRRADAIVADQGLGVWGRGGDAGRGDGFDLFEPLSDGQVQFEKLGQQVLFGGEAIGGEDGGIQGGVGVLERVCAGQFEGAVEEAQAAFDGLAIVKKLGPGRAGREEGERPPALGQVREGQLVLGRVEVGVEVVNPELVEVAEDDLAGAPADDTDPVIEGLAEVLLQVESAGLCQQAIGAGLGHGFGLGNDERCSRCQV